MDPDAVCPHKLNCSQYDGRESFDIGLLPTYLSLASSSLSCLGSLLILLAYILLKDMRTGAQKVITLLAVADFFTAFGYIIGGSNYLEHFDVVDSTRCKRFHVVCEIQSFVTTWSTMSSYLWTSILAFYFFLVLVFNRSALAGKLLPFYNILAWAVPLTIMIPLLLTDNLGYAPFVASNWCYIKDNHYSTQSLTRNRKVIALILVGGKLWEIITYVWISVLYFTIRVKVSQRARILNAVPMAGRIELRLLAIPLLYIVCRMWGTLQFFFSLSVSTEIKNGCVTPGIHWAFLLFGYFQAIGDGAQGWGNAILYIFLSPTIRRRLIINPCNRCLNTAMERAAILLESDSRSHSTTTARAERSILGHTDTKRVTKNPGHTDATVTQYGSTGSSDTTYHSFPSDVNTDSGEPLPKRSGRSKGRRSRSVQGGATPPVFAVLQSAGVSREVNRVDGNSSSYLYESLSPETGFNQFSPSHSPENHSDSG